MSISSLYLILCKYDFHDIVKDIIICFISLSKYMFMAVISVYSGLPWKKIGCPKILQLPIFGTQFLNPG